MSNKGSKEEQFILKYNFLKKSIVEERNKSTMLQKENETLRDELINHKEINAKLQEEIVQLRGNTGQKKIKQFFNTFFDSNDGSSSNNNKLEEETLKREQLIQEDRLNQLLQENNALKEQIIIITTDKEDIQQRLNTVIKECEMIRESNNSKIASIYKLYEDRDISNNEQNKRIEMMSSMIRKLEHEKIDNEKQIELLIQDSKLKADQFEILFKEQNQLLEEIDSLTEEVQELKIEKKALLKSLEDLMPITAKTIFKGSRIINQNPKKTDNIELTFGEIDKSLVIREENKNDKIIKLSLITEIRKIEANLFKFIIQCDDDTDVFLIEMPDKNIKYILKFYHEGTIKSKIVSNFLMTYTVGDYFV